MVVVDVVVVDACVREQHGLHRGEAEGGGTLAIGTGNRHATCRHEMLTVFAQTVATESVSAGIDLHPCVAVAACDAACDAADQHPAAMMIQHIQGSVISTSSFSGTIGF